VEAAMHQCFLQIAKSPEQEREEKRKNAERVVGAKNELAVAPLQGWPLSGPMKTVTTMTMKRRRRINCPSTCSLTSKLCKTRGNT